MTDIDIKRVRDDLAGLSNDGRDDAPWKARTRAKMHCWEVVDANGHVVATCDDTLSHRPLFIANARTLVPELLNEVERLRSLLADACELADEGIAYTGDYFSDKWDMPGRLAAIRAAVGGGK